MSPARRKRNGGRNPISSTKTLSENRRHPAGAQPPDKNTDRKIIERTEIGRRPPGREKEKIPGQHRQQSAKDKYCAALGSQPDLQRRSSLLHADFLQVSATKKPERFSGFFHAISCYFAFHFSPSRFSRREMRLISFSSSPVTGVRRIIRQRNR